MQLQVQGTGGVKPEFVFENGENPSELLTYARGLDYKGSLGELFYFPSLEGPGQLLVGLGKEDELTFNGLRKAFFNVGKLLNDKKEDAVEIHNPGYNDLCHGRAAMAITEGLLLSTYRFDKYLSDRKPVRDLNVYYWPAAGKEEKVKPWLDRGQKIFEGIKVTRDLVNERANVIYPETLADQAKELLEPVGVKVTVWDEEKIQEEGMEAFYSVAKGSVRPPRFIIMEYNGDPSTEARTGLVGKGMTYDSGGYSIKSTPGMLTMNCDMGGAGTVIGTMHTLASLKAEINVTAFVAAAENMISGTAYKPGDIIGSLSGKTIEIRNTDAEGRVTLADAMWYATDVAGVDRVIDLATLTGACVVALGDEHTGALTNDQTFMDELKEASDEAGEPIWQMPGNGAYSSKNKSKVADVANSGDRGGGMMSAGEFVGEFVANDTPWIHLDIAGTAWLNSSRDYYAEGATGIHVRTLVMMLGDLTCDH